MNLNQNILTVTWSNISFLKSSSIRQVLITLLCFFSLSACQLTMQEQTESLASDYYLWLQTLSNDELQQEINQQQNNKKAGIEQADINLILLYALPSSPVYNPYTAKSMLNKLSSSINFAELASQDYALLNLLREQLNQHILTTNKLLALKQESAEQALTHQQDTANKLKEIKKLQQQLTQLKRIELSIENER